MKRGSTLLLWLCTCHVNVELGAPAGATGDTGVTGPTASAADQPRLVAEATGISFAGGNALRLRNMPDGALLVCDDRECAILGSNQEQLRLRLAPPGHVEDIIAPPGLMGRVLVATGEGLSLCSLTDSNHCEAQKDLVPPRTLVLGLARAGAGVLFVTSNAIGIWDIDARRITTYDDTVALPAPIVGTTNAGDWLRLSRSPFLCRLMDGACIGLTISAGVAQVIPAGPERWVVATLGAGVVIVERDVITTITEGLPSLQVLDLVSWQGAVWLATDHGLARLDPDTRAITKTDALAATRVLALGVTNDGSLAAYGGEPAQLYLLHTDP